VGATLIRGAGRVLLGWVLGLVLAEAVLRVFRPGAAHLAIYAEGGGAGVRLAPGAEVRARLPAGDFRAAIDADGLRAPSPPDPEWLVIGDSAAFGLGVEGDETLAAHLTARGHPAGNAGVPGFGVVDALAHAAALPSPRRGWILVVNPADDALPLDATVTTRFEVAAPWLVTRGTSGPVKALLRSPLSRSALFVELAAVGGMIRHGRADPRPAWVTAPDGGAAAFRAIGERVRAEAGAREVIAVWLPFDAVQAPERAAPSPYAHLSDGWDDARARAGLAEGLGAVPLVAPTFTEGWLPYDHHLSPEGNAALAEAVSAALTGA
jgi:hypothetical protein